LGKSLVSVVVPTFNSERFLNECLKSVREQTYGNVEVIVVDRYSTDRTKEIAESHGARITESEAKRSEARNVGAEKARGSLIFFADSDMELDSSVVDECVKEIGKEYDAVTIPEISVGESFWAKCKALEKACYLSDNQIESARFFKRSVLESIGGYDIELEAGEDWDLNQRTIKAGYRIGRIDAFVKHHEGRLSLRETTLKKHYYGKKIGPYRKKHPKEAKQQLKLIRPAFIRNWRELAKDPVHAFGLLFMKTCEFIAGFLAVVEFKGSRREG
jgi:glycosyltransferase involved in cell wall biosynthesis